MNRSWSCKYSEVPYEVQATDGIPQDSNFTPIVAPGATMAAKNLRMHLFPLMIACTMGFWGLAVLGGGVAFFGAVEANGACGLSVTTIGLWFTTL